MSGKLFGRTNINDVLFNVEQQEGSDILEGDTNVASIGDATLAHIQALSCNERFDYDEYFTMPDGNIFRILNELRWEDPNEFNLTDKDELDTYMRSHKLPEDHRPIVEEAVQRIQGEDPEYEDVMDHREELIPYHEWEKFPGLWSQWDIPPTPRRRLQFCGNTRKIFYDHMPEGHPMQDLLERILYSLDQYKWEHILTLKDIHRWNKDTANPIGRTDDMKPSYLWTDGKIMYLQVEAFIKSYRYVIFCSQAPYKYKVNVYENMRDMVLKIADGKIFPRILAEEFLNKVEQFWTEHYLATCHKITEQKDPIYHYLTVEGDKLISLAKQGKVVYNRLKKIGRNLYQHGLLCKKINSEDKWQTVVEHPKKRHWRKYRAIETELLVIMRKLERRKAVNKFTTFLIKKISATAEKAVKTRNLKDYTKIAGILIKMDKNGELKCSKQEMQTIWAHYNSTKNQLIKSLTSHKRIEASG
jgi:hypothetical protein